MIEIDIGLIGSSKPLSLVDQIKTVTKEILYDYAIKYLTNHTYINSKKLAIYYLNEVFDFTPIRSDYNTLRSTLTHRFRYMITILLQEHKIIGYSPSLYKRVNTVKSLYTNIKVLGLDTKNNDSCLVFSQGRFVNPKFYNL